MPEDQGGIYFIDPEEEDVKDIMTNARRKFEIQMPAAMLYKTPCASRETCRKMGNTKQNTVILSKLTNL